MVAVVLVFSCVLGQKPPLDPARVVERYNDAMCSIHTLSVTIDGKRSVDGGQTWTPMYHIAVRRKGDVDRVHTKLFGMMQGSHWVDAASETDMRFSLEDTRTMGGIDAGSPHSLPLAGKDQLAVSGNIVPPSAEHGCLRSSQWTSFAMFLFDPEYSLKELFERSSPKQFKLTRDDRWGDLVELHLSNPERKMLYTVSIAPQHQNLLAKITYKSQDSSLPTDGEDLVVEEQEASPGLTLPRVLRSIDRLNPREIVEVTLGDLKVNEPITDAELALEFLPGMIVHDGIVQKYCLWGDGKPARIFKSNDEFVAWHNDLSARFNGRLRPSFPWMPVISFAGAVIGLAAVLIYRRRVKIAGV